MYVGTQFDNSAAKVTNKTKSAKFYGYNTTRFLDNCKKRVVLYGNILFSLILSIIIVLKKNGTLMYLYTPLGHILCDTGGCSLIKAVLFCPQPSFYRIGATDHYIYLYYR